MLRLLPAIKKKKKNLQLPPLLDLTVLTCSKVENDIIVGDTYVCLQILFYFSVTSDSNGHSSILTLCSLTLVVVIPSLSFYTMPCQSYKLIYLKMCLLFP